jgi:hypothetical protein
MNEAELRPWLDQAWNDHADAPQRVADELLARAAALPDDADGAEALRFGLHVLLGHLDDAAAVRRLMAAAPAGERLTPAADRARWALATLDGDAAPALPDAARWGALRDVVIALVQRGDVARARSLLFAEEDAAAAAADDAARKAYASSANNVAADLRAGPRDGGARDALMLEAAALARRAWEHAGTWVHVERADHQLAMCHAAVNQGTEAMRHARACLDRCEAEGADAAERFFAHEALVHAHRAAAAEQRARMAALLEEIDDAGMRSWCADTLAKL